MNTYLSIVGERVDLSGLKPADQLLVHRLIVLKGTCEAPPRKSPTAFADLARKEIRKVYPDQNGFMRAVHGPIGVAYRDGFYRLLLDTTEQAGREKVLQNIRHHPARILVDRFLDECGTQAEFAEKSGLDAAVISSAFRTVLISEPEESARLALGRFKDACERLGIVPACGYANPSQESSAIPDVLAPSRVTVTSRERQLRLLIAAAARYICSSVGDRAQTVSNCRKLLGLHLAAIYEVRDVLLLDRLVNIILEDILVAPVFEAVAKEGGSAKTVRRLVDFQLGLRAEEQPVLFCNSEISDDELSKALGRGLRVAGRDPETAELEQSPCAKEGENAEYCREVIEHWNSVLNVFGKWVVSSHYRKSNTHFVDAVSGQPQDAGDKPRCRRRTRCVATRASETAPR